MTSDIDIEAVGPDGLPLIFHHIEREDIPSVQAWIAAGGNLEVTGFQDATPALAAAVVDNWPVVLLFLKAGANPNPADGRGFTIPFLSATSRVVPDGRYGAALAEVRAFLNDRGLLAVIHEPPDVRRMLADGRWPPR